MVFLALYKWTHGRTHRWANRQNVMGVKMGGGGGVKRKKTEFLSVDCLWHIISEEEKKLSKLPWSEEWGRKIKTGNVWVLPGWLVSCGVGNSCSYKQEDQGIAFIPFPCLTQHWFWLWLIDVLCLLVLLENWTLCLVPEVKTESLSDLCGSGCAFKKITWLQIKEEKGKLFGKVRWYSPLQFM